MRIVHVVRQFYPAVGGLETFVRCLASEQVKQGHDVTVVTLDRVFYERAKALADIEGLDGIAIKRVGFVGSRRYPIAPGVLRHLGEADIVHVHAIDFFCDFLSAMRPLHRRPLVITTHGGFFHTPYAAGLKQIYFKTVSRLSLTGYRRVFACSEADMQTFRPVASSRLRLIENGVDIEKFAGAASATWVPKLIYLGRLSSNKGLTELVRAFAVARELLPEAKLDIVGNDWDGVLPGLRQLIDELGVRDSVRVLSQQTDSDVRALIGSSSFFVSASKYEAFGLSTIEGMAAGLLPVANTIPAFVELIGKTNVGLLVDFSDPRTAGRAMGAFMKKAQDSYDQERARAIEAAQPFGWKLIARRYTDAYVEALGLERRNILGVDIAVKRRGEAVADVDRAIEGGGDPLKVAFANANTLNLAADRAEVRRALSGFLVLNDGLGVDIASRLKFGRRFEDNLNGTDFVPDYLTATRHRLKIFLLGAKQDVVEAARREFETRWPRHQIVGARNGYFSDEDDVTAAVRRSSADLVLVALGNPQQELWIAENASKSGAKVLMGVGALFDFVAGAVPRAPDWVRSMRCEWLYRLYREPVRLAKRYLVGNAAFLYHVLRSGPEPAAVPRAMAQPVAKASRTSVRPRQASTADMPK